MSCLACFQTLNMNTVLQSTLVSSHGHYKAWHKPKLALRTKYCSRISPTPCSAPLPNKRRKTAIGELFLSFLNVYLSRMATEEKLYSEHVFPDTESESAPVGSSGAPSEGFFPSPETTDGASVPEATSKGRYKLSVGKAECGRQEASSFGQTL
jgi:hypothetical protein